MDKDLIPLVHEKCCTRQPQIIKEKLYYTKGNERQYYHTNPIIQSYNILAMVFATQLALNNISSIKHRLRPYVLVYTILVVFNILSLFRSKTMMVAGYSNGAGSCIGGQAAIGDSHLNKNNGQRRVYGGNLTEGNVTVTINGNIVMKPNEVVHLQSRQIHRLKVATATNPGYKGVLYRIDAPSGIDTTNAISPVNDNDLKISDLCISPVVGLTHASARNRMFTEALVQFNDPVKNVTLDITLVAINDDRASLFGFSRYLMSFHDEPIPTTAPKSSPTSPPTITLELGNNGVAPNPIPTLSPLQSPNQSSSYRITSNLSFYINTLFVPMVCYLVFNLQ
jgi:hypothetical protein